MVSEVDSAGVRAASAPYALAVPRSAPLRALLAFLAGGALAAAFAPLDLWPLAILAPAVLMWLWQDVSPREAARLGFLFSCATFAAGTYWLYISIHGFGGAPLWVAFALMLGLVGIMGLYQAALGYSVARWLPRSGAARYLLALPASWLLVEWWRGWFLSGFSWLSLGYSQTDTWLAAFAPIAGVYGISALLLVCAGALTALVSGAPRLRVPAIITFLVPWLLGAALYHHSWTHPSGPAVSVAVVQGAIPQEQKWLDTNHDYTLQLYRRLTEQALGKAALIVWPESATADIANDLVPYINSLYREARAHGSALLMGILRAEQGKDGQVHYYNSVLGLGDSVSWYDKHHLVPFAEFFPVPQFVRSWLRLMSLPYSDFTPGGAHQPPQPLAHLQLGTTVCYEDAYGSSMLYVLHQGADVLVNVTNDAWFGHSTARHQHFQIARMRALEAGRYMIRAANDGISGIIGPHGEVVDRAAEFVPLTLVEKVVPYTGLTPYAHLGNWLIVSLATLALAYGLWVRNDRGRRPLEGSS